MVSGIIAGMSVATKATVVTVLKVAACVDVAIISRAAYRLHKERKEAELDLERRAIEAITGGSYEKENNC